jgi:hypothetical protein
MNTRYELRVASCEFQVAGYELQVTSYVLRVASDELRVTSHNLQVFAWVDVIVVDVGRPGGCVLWDEWFMRVAVW